MTDPEREIILAAALECGQQDADRHYAALIEAFLSAIPEHFHRLGDFAPKINRPLAFNADADSFQFFLRIGDDYATTSVIFNYKKKLKAWKVKCFVSQIGSGPFVYSSVESKTLANALLASRELYIEIKAKAEAVEDTPQIDSRVTVN